MSRARKERERKERARQYKAGLKPYDLTRLTAFHEAGHVVFSTFHGNPVEIVTIDMQRVEELTGRKGCPGYTRYTREGYADADTVLMMTAVGLASEAMLVSGGVINPREDDLSRLHDILENQMGLEGEAKNRTVSAAPLRCCYPDCALAVAAAGECLLPAPRSPSNLDGVCFAPYPAVRCTPNHARRSRSTTKLCVRQFVS